MNIGDTITLRGKTQKGKNRICEHGNKWEIKDICPSVFCLNGSPGFLIATDRDWRWIKQVDDQDFEVIT